MLSLTNKKNYPQYSLVSDVLVKHLKVCARITLNIGAHYCNS